MFGSPIHTNRINPTPPPSRTPYHVNTITKETIGIKSIDRKIDCKLIFVSFLWNGQCIFYTISHFTTKYTLCFTFIIFQRLETYFGYFIIITITTYYIATAIERPANNVSLIVCFKKNNFEIAFIENFYHDSSQCLHILMILLIYFTVIYKFLTVYHYIAIYQLHKNMVFLLYHNKYNTYKIYIKYIIVLKNYLKITQVSMYYYYITSKATNNHVLWYSRYVCILIYFLKFFKYHGFFAC